MSDQNNWEQKFQEWTKKAGFEKEPTGLEVFQKLMENQCKDSQSLLTDLQSHIDQIDVILKETPSERPNE